MPQPTIAGETVAQVFRNSADAHDAAQRLRAAGFPDIRVSERAGETSEAHVAAETGLTEIDFEESLRRAGFDAADVHGFTRDVARGGVLLTLAAGARAADAVAVLRGESVIAPVLHPADHRTAVDPAAAAPSGVPLAAATATPVIPAPASSDTPTGVAERARASTDAAPPIGAAPQTADTVAETRPDDRILQLRAERLDVTKERETSEARVRRVTVTEQQTITVPVSHEELVIERDGLQPVRVPLGESSASNDPLRRGAAGPG